MFDKQFFTKNRINLANKLPNSLICIPAHSLLQESADLAFPFRQDSSFWYFTGVNTPDVTLVIDTKKGKSTLLIPKQNDYQKEWDGVQNIKELIAVSGVDAVESQEKLQELLKYAKNSQLQICYLAPLPARVEPYGFYANPSRSLLEKELKKVESDLKDIRSEVASLRQVKQYIEIKTIQQAIDITADTLAEVKYRLQSFKSEKEVENAITAGFFARNSQGHAYEPIVASGVNASIIHYNDNNNAIKKNELLLLDVGAKVDGYASDISRTWAVGSVDKRRQKLFDVVLELQQIAFSELRPGVIIKDYQKKMELSAKKIFEANGVKLDTYPHGFSHFLGLDVHDAGLYDKPLQEGAVLTVEPGVYLRNEKIGIRVEDNILITKNGIKNLSEHIPKVLY